MIVQDRPAASPSPAENSLGSIALLRLLIARHPYTSALFFLVYWLALLLALGRVLAPLYYATHLSYLPYETLGELLLALIVVLPLTLLKWWSETGFTRGINGNGILICLLPLLFIVGPTTLAIGTIAGRASGLILLFAAILSLLVGFAEEGMFRGVILRALLPKGIWPAVITSAMCFGCVHLTNLLGGASLGYVAEQIILAFGAGILFATLRLRTGSIWPGILLHAGRDIVGLIYIGINPKSIQATPSTATLVIDLVFFLIYLSISLVLLRPKQLNKLRVTYGLVKVPEPALSIPYPTPYNPGFAPYQQPFPFNPTPGNQSQSITTPDNFFPQNTGLQQGYTSPPVYGDKPGPETPT